METSEILTTGAAALLFAAVFIVGGKVHPFRSMVDRRSIVSFCAGMSVAYVFVHLMPELHDVRSSFVASMSVPMRYEGLAIYFFALIGFLVFYGLDHLRKHLRKAEIEGEGAQAFRLHVGGFAIYVALVSYLLVNSLEDTQVSIALYATAIALHFLAVDHSLNGEYGDAYRRVGRFVLAGMAVLGWGVGVLFALPTPVLALMVAFISGAIVMNSTIMELPSEKDGRFLPFTAGGVVYGLILLPLA
jgi:hypothetical protein